MPEVYRDHRRRIRHRAPSDEGTDGRAESGQPVVIADGVLPLGVTERLLQQNDVVRMSGIPGEGLVR